MGLSDGEHQMSRYRCSLQGACEAAVFNYPDSRIMAEEWAIATLMKMYPEIPVEQFEEDVPPMIADEVSNAAKVR